MVREVVHFALGHWFQICDTFDYSFLELVGYDVVILLEKF